MISWKPQHHDTDGVKLQTKPRYHSGQEDEQETREDTGEAEEVTGGHADRRVWR